MCTGPRGPRTAEQYIKMEIGIRGILSSRLPSLLLQTQNLSLRACSYGQKLSRLARKLFDKFTSEISPCHENNMKSYTEFI
jgi:hypothetical protein